MPYYPPPSGGGGAGTVIVTTPSGVPSIAADTIQFPNGFVTDLGSGDASIGTPPQAFIGVKAYATAVQSISNTTVTAVTMDSEEYDTDGFHSTSSNTSRLTIPAGMGGKYLIVAGSYWNTSPGTQGELLLRKNGSTNLRAAEATPTGVLRQSVVAFADLAAGDYIELTAYQNSGGAIDLGHASALSAQSNVALFKLDSGKAGNAIGAIAYATATQSIPTATTTGVTFDSEEYDTDGFHDTSSNTSRLTIPAGLGGLYLLTGAVYMAAPNGAVEVGFRLNGATSLRGWASMTVATGSTDGWINVNATAYLSAGDYVELCVYQASGGSKTIGHASARDAQCRASVVRLDSGSNYNPFGQVNPKSAQGSGNDDEMYGTANWVDTDAFSTKEVLDGTVLHLQTIGASQDDRVRYTLGTTRAGAFDFRFYGVMLSCGHWSSDFDTYLELYVTTSGGTGMAMCRLGANNTVLGNKKLRVGQTGVVSTNVESIFPAGTAIDIRIVRDGSNNVTFYFRITGASGWHQMLKASDGKPYSVSSSGTIARVELSIHTPSGPASGEHVCDAYVDAFRDAS